jgi:hypothetical protein
MNMNEAGFEHERPEFGASLSFFIMIFYYAGFEEKFCHGFKLTTVCLLSVVDPFGNL